MFPKQFNKPANDRAPALTHLQPLATVLVVLLLSTFGRPAHCQAPALLWTTNIGARVFAVDGQTNAYAQAGANGTVIKLSSAGVPLQTNNLSSYPGMAQRDADGNLYYSGKYPGTWTGSWYEYSTPACFLAKYNSTGALIWSVDFGPTGALRTIGIKDLKIDNAGNCYVGFTYNLSTTDHSSLAAKIDSSGSVNWTVFLPKTFYPTTLGSARLGLVSGTNLYALTFASYAPSYVTLLRLDVNGNVTVVTNWTTPSGAAWQAASPIDNALSEFYDVEADRLTERAAAGTAIWTRIVSSSLWTLGQDRFDGVHIADDNGLLARYDSDGVVAWTTNFWSRCTALVLDAAGNRFVSLLDGTVARLGNEPLSAPIVTNAPQGATVLAGSNYLFSVGASGSGPLRYFWLFNNSPLPNQTNATLWLTSVTSAQGGLYSVIVSNFLGSVTSSPATLRVKSVAIFLGNQLLTNGTYTFASPPTLNIRSAFANGSIFYTLDGSSPSFSSTHYSGPFTLTHSATVRAIGYSADFSQSEEADIVYATVLVNHTLTASSSTGGSVSLNPPGGTYVSTNVVTATAVPAAGWAFLYWLGDASGTNPTVNLSMDQDRTVSAVFGTTLSTTVTGNGQILLYPPGGLYAYGTVVRLTGVPQPGNYFGFWGNAASGNTNPLYFTIVAPTQTISSIFGALPADQAALTVLITGNGRVNVSPRANAYSTNQSVTLTAIPDAGQSFVNWSGDASGTQNPLTVAMTQSKVITANFSSRRPQLRVDRPGIEGLTPEGFRFTLVSDPGSIWQIFGTTNLNGWDLLGTVTNGAGEVQYTDPGALNLSRRFYRAVQ